MSVLRLDAKPPPAMATRREEPMATSDEAGEADWATIITATNEEEDTSAEQLQPADSSSKLGRCGIWLKRYHMVSGNPASSFF